MKFDSGFEEN